MVQQSSHYTRTAHSEKLKWIEHMVNLMDNQFRVPGTKFRFGLDPILGFIPVAGDLASFAISASIVMTMARHGASSKLVVLMLLNIGIDALIGSIPILGNIFDFFFKANERNVRLLKAHYEEGRYQGSGKKIAIGVLLALIIISIILLWALWKLAVWAYHFLAGLF
jgi:hypothetical protein